MSETPEQYTQRMLSYVAKKNPLTIWAATPKKLSAAIRRLSPAQLRKSPAPGKWSIAEILAHLSDTEMVIGYRLRMMLNKNGTEIQAFDQDNWARTGKYSRQAPAKSLAEFSAIRSKNLALLRSIPKEAWENYGMHQERGRESVAHTTRMIAGHDINHLLQVERIAKALRKR